MFLVSLFRYLKSTDLKDRKMFSNPFDFDPLKFAKLLEDFFIGDEDTSTSSTSQAAFRLKKKEK